MTIWADIQTKNGFASDEVQSSLQKYIRRAKVEEACQAAYELYTSGPVFLDKMWSRLETIAVEDVGFGDLNVPVLIHALDQMRKNFPYNDGINLCILFMRFACFVHVQRIVQVII